MVKSNKKRKLLVPDCGSNELTGDPDDRSYPFSNKSLVRLTSKPISEKMSISISIEEICNIEKRLYSMVESQMWFFGGNL